MTHDLKTWPEPFYATYRGDKPWEFRKDDRNFEVGDYLVLKLWCPDEKKFLGSDILCKVIYKLSGPVFGIPEGYCVMSIYVFWKTETTQESTT